LTRGDVLFVRSFSLALMLVGLAVAVIAQSLAPSIATVHLVARLAPHAEITAITSASPITTRRPTNDRMVLEAAPGADTSLTFDFLTNTRATLIKANMAGAVPTLDVAPVTTTCDWVHDEISVSGIGTVASLTRCTPSQPQRALIRIGPRTQPVTLTIIIEPLAN
jgi:hypothetical protein